MRSFTSFDLQYAHRFYGFRGEAQYLHGHTGHLTIEVEDSINEGVNMVFPCNEIKKTAWDVLKNFDHALVLRKDDPLLPAILGVYDKQGIREGHPQNKMKGEAFKTELATAYPDCRLVVTKDTMTVEGMIKIVYELLKEKLNIPPARQVRVILCCENYAHMEEVIAGLMASRQGFGFELNVTNDYDTFHNPESCIYVHRGNRKTLSSRAAGIAADFWGWLVG